MGRVTVADHPEFPVGGVDLLGGRGPPTWALFTKNVWQNERIVFHRGVCEPLMWVFFTISVSKMKELGPVGGVCRARSPPLDPPMGEFILIRMTFPFGM